MYGKRHDEHRPDYQPRNAYHEQGDETPQIITPIPFVDGGEKPQRYARAHGKAKSHRSKAQRNRQALRDNVHHRTIAVLERRPEIAMHDAIEIAQVLAEDRFIK